MKNGNNQYKKLGQELSRIRMRSQESLAEVSGAVEISDERLVAYEKGDMRPSEDILQLLITHFNLHDEESENLWELAGYNDKNTPTLGSGDEIVIQQPAIMLMPLDARIVYSDTYQVTINQYGVVMNFMQNAGSSGQPIAVSRIGMSLEHAKKVSEILQQTIKTASEFPKTRNLPSPKPEEDNKV